MGSEALEKLGFNFSLLKDLRLEIEAKDNSFIVCFWVYLPKSTPFPSTILHQSHCDSPFLALGEDKNLTLSPAFFLRKEVSDSSRSVPCIVSEVEFPLERWVHLGCEVCSNAVRIHLDGKVVGERLLDFSLAKEVEINSVTKVTLSAMWKGLESLDGYVHNAEVLPSTSSVKDHQVKDPPLQLSVDSASTSDIELESDGIWTIVGGKISCRKTFSLDVFLLDAFGKPVDKELQVVASLIYYDDQAPVENSEDDEASLLAICDGLEFPSGVKPSRLSQGRASFKMTISQLTSKCNNKLFCIKFNFLRMGIYPFLEAFTPPIRCISRTHNAQISTITWKKLPSGIHLFNGSCSPQYGVGNSELQQKTVCDARPGPSSKRVRVGQDTPSPATKVDNYVQGPDEECNSDSVPEDKVKSAIRTSLESLQENYGGIDNSASDSESVGARNSELNMPCHRELISDLTIFRYCLGGLSERSLMLKEISLFVSEPDIADMAEKVSFFSGCTHHRYQIMITKRLLEEGERVWNLISQNSYRVHWDNVVFEIEEQFMRIACCSTRSLTQQDLNFLRRIAGGHEYMTKDDFDKMWRWLYPVAFTISREEINALWASTSPRWIEGFVTKEEVEYALQSPFVIQEPGTFILRFPTTRSWPHPDAGSLVASYVGRDFSLHHRQLSLEYSSDMCETNPKPLHELLLSEPELSRVGRITRSDLTV